MRTQLDERWEGRLAELKEEERKLRCGNRNEALSRFTPEEKRLMREGAQKVREEGNRKEAPPVLELVELKRMSPNIVGVLFNWHENTAQGGLMNSIEYWSQTLNDGGGGMHRTVGPRSIPFLDRVLWVRWQHPETGRITECRHTFRWLHHEFGLEGLKALVRVAIRMGTGLWHGPNEVPRMRPETSDVLFGALAKFGILNRAVEEMEKLPEPEEPKKKAGGQEGKARSWSRNRFTSRGRKRHAKRKLSTRPKNPQGWNLGLKTGESVEQRLIGARRNGWTLERVAEYSINLYSEFSEQGKTDQAWRAEVFRLAELNGFTPEEVQVAMELRLNRSEE